jgi:hypothetical protein
LTAVRRYWLGDAISEGGDHPFSLNLLDKKWVSTDHQDWDAAWSSAYPPAELFAELKFGQRFNHLPGISALCNKAALAHNLSEGRLRLEGTPMEARLDIVPQTFSLPQEREELAHFVQDHPETRWIQKPKGAARGAGVALLQTYREAPDCGDYLVQRYLERPHLRSSFKYVLRCYVVLTSLVPLRAYLYHEGFQKLATEPFTLESTSPFIHLTNPDINRQNQKIPDYYTLSEYRRWLSSENWDADRLWQRIQSLVTATVATARRSILSAGKLRCEGCYELLGLDILVDCDRRPWLLECNVGPSLNIESGTGTGGRREYLVKTGLLKDLQALVGVEPWRVWGPSVADFEAEVAACSRFQAVFPTGDMRSDLALLRDVRKEDLELGMATSAQPPPELFVNGDALSTFEEDHVIITCRGSTHRLNSTAGFVWARLQDGCSPKRIAAELSSQFGTPLSAMADAVWLAVAELGAAEALSFGYCLSSGGQEVGIL